MISIIVLLAVALATQLVAPPSASAVTGVWSTPVQLNTGPNGYGGGDASSPRLASSADGTKIVSVFKRREVRLDGQYDRLNVSRSTDGGVNWSGGTVISEWGAYANDPQIASSEDGTKLVAVWVAQMSYPNFHVMVSRSSNSGLSWTPQTSLSTSGRISGAPQVKMSADGTKITVIWYEFDGTSSTVRSKSSTDSGATWSTTTVLSAASTGEMKPQLASSADGTKLTAVWRMQNGSNSIIQSKSSTNAGSTWSASATDLIGAVGDAKSQQITSSSDGLKVTAIWTVNDSGKYVVRTRSSADGGATWSASIPSLSASGQDSTLPQIVSSSDGTKLSAVWLRNDGSFKVVQTSASSDSGATWSTVSDLTATGRSAENPQIIGSANGATLTAAWNRPNVSTGTQQIEARASTDRGANWSAAVTVSNVTTVQNSEPALAGSSDGSVVGAVWWYGAGSAAYTVVQAAAVSTLAAGLTPMFGAVTRTVDGFTVAISNYDAAYGWAVSSVAGSASVSSGTVTVTGLAAGASTSITVTSTRSGYANGSATSSGQALAAQTVTWSPTTSVTLPSSPLTPSVLASALGGAVVSYAVTSAGTTGCAVDSLSGVLTYSAAGSCTVRASAAATTAYAAGSRDVTFAIARNTPTLDWSPDSTMNAAASPITFATATSNSSGNITYAVSADAGAGCVIADASLPVVTVVTSGTCTITAQVAQSDVYSARTQSVTFTVTLSTPMITWTPATSLTMPAATITPASATSTSPGAITYAVTSDTGTNCLVNALTGAMSYAGAGQCQVTATVAATPRFAAASVDAIFSVSLAAQAIVVSATSTSLAPNGNATLSTSGSSGTGNVTLTQTSGQGNCSLSGVTVSALTDGDCEFTATIAADANYEAASATITITVATPAPSAGGSTSGTGPERSLDAIPENGGLTPGSQFVTVDGQGVPARIEANTTGTGLDVIGDGWRIAISCYLPDGSLRALEPGGVMAITAGSKLDVSGSGFDDLAQVRIYLLSRTTHLGSLMTDTSGDFTGSVIAPADATIGSDTLQINGFTRDRLVRSVSIGVQVLSPEFVKTIAVGSRIHFRYRSAVLTAKAKRSLIAMIAQVHQDPLATTVVTGALRSHRTTAYLRSLAAKRATVVRKFLVSHGMLGTVEVRVRRIVVRNDYRDRRVEISVMPQVGLHLNQG